MSALWLGDAVEQAILWLLDTFRWFFDGISTVMTVLVEAISAALLGLPPAAWLVLFAAAAFFAGGWRLSGYTVLAFALIWSLELWEETMDTLALARSRQRSPP